MNTDQIKECKFTNNAFGKGMYSIGMYLPTHGKQPVTFLTVNKWFTVWGCCDDSK
jgi:hypothetical protein